MVRNLNRVGFHILFRAKLMAEVSRKRRLKGWRRQFCSFTALRPQAYSTLKSENKMHQFHKGYAWPARVP